MTYDSIKNAHRRVLVENILWFLRFLFAGIVCVLVFNAHQDTIAVLGIQTALILANEPTLPAWTIAWIHLGMFVILFAAVWIGIYQLTEPIVQSSLLQLKFPYKQIKNIARRIYLQYLDRLGNIIRGLGFVAALTLVPFLILQLTLMYRTSDDTVRATFFYLACLVTGEVLTIGGAQLAKNGVEIFIEQHWPR
jgi:hypothetical protein